MARDAIFISYRRSDSAHFAGRLYAELRAALGDDSLFMDIDKLRPGMNFKKHLEQTLDQCRLMLVVMPESMSIERAHV